MRCTEPRPSSLPTLSAGARRRRRRLALTGRTKPHYHDEGGAHLSNVVRLENPKDFRQQRADGVWKMDGVRRVLYQLPSLQGASVVYIPEGEKDVEALRAIGLTASSGLLRRMSTASIVDSVSSTVAGSALTRPTCGPPTIKRSSAPIATKHGAFSNTKPTIPICELCCEGHRSPSTLGGGAGRFALVPRNAAVGQCCYSPEASKRALRSFPDEPCGNRFTSGRRVGTSP